MNEAQNELLNEIYYNPTTGFVGVKSLFKKAQAKQSDIKESDVEKWLANQETRQINKQQHRQQPHLPIFSGRRYSFQMDLAFIPTFKNQNKGYHVILTCININTRRAYAYKSKNKTTKSIMDMLRQFYKDTGGHIQIITSDNGSEFIAKSIQDWAKSKEIEWFFAEPENHNKLGKIERFNRTLKERLNNYFTSTGKPIWYNVLNDFIFNYNHTYHRSIQMKPIDVTYEDEKEIVLQSKYKTNEIKTKRTTVPTFRRVALNSVVRIKLPKQIFDKIGKRFSEELFRVEHVTPLGYFKLRKISTNRMEKRTFKFNDVQPVDVNKLFTKNQNELETAKQKAKQSNQLQKENIDLNDIDEAEVLVNQQQKEKQKAKEKKQLQKEKKKEEKKKKMEEDKKEKAMAFLKDIQDKHLKVVADDDGDVGEVLNIQLNDKTGHYMFFVRFTDGFERFYTKSEIQSALKKVKPPKVKPPKVEAKAQANQP